MRNEEGKNTLTPRRSDRNEGKVAFGRPVDGHGANDDRMSAAPSRGSGSSIGAGGGRLWVVALALLFGFAGYWMGGGRDAQRKTRLAAEQTKIERLREEVERQQSAARELTAQARQAEEQARAARNAAQEHVRAAEEKARQTEQEAARQAEENRRLEAERLERERLAEENRKLAAALQERERLLEEKRKLEEGLLEEKRKLAAALQEREYLLEERRKQEVAKKLGEESQRGVSGQGSFWVNPDNGERYAVMPEPAYQRDNRLCRQTEIDAVIDGRRERTLTTVCRTPGGQWELR